MDEDWYIRKFGNSFLHGSEPLGMMVKKKIPTHLFYGSTKVNSLNKSDTSSVIISIN